MKIKQDVEVTVDGVKLDVIGVTVSLDRQNEEIEIDLKDHRKTKRSIAMISKTIFEIKTRRHPKCCLCGNESIPGTKCPKRQTEADNG